jgi:hypothetical protein
MGEFVTTVNATSNSSANTADTFVELSGTVLGIKRIRVRLGDGTATAGVDNDFVVSIVRKTAGGATGTGGTITKMNIMGGASNATVNVKNTTSAFTTATQQAVIDSMVCNGRAILEWVARDEDDIIRNHITLGSGGMLAINIASSVVSQKFQVSVFWVEA